MSKVVSYEKVHRDYIKSKGEYPFKGSIKNFNEEEIELIKKYGYWFTGLCSGELPLFTPQQKEFKKLYDKIYSLIKVYPPTSTIWWEHLTEKQKTWVKYVRLIEKEKQKNTPKVIQRNTPKKRIIPKEKKQNIPKDEQINILFKKNHESENKSIPNSYILTNDLSFYLTKIIGLTDDDKKIIKENIEYWKSIFNKPFSYLNDKEKSLVKSLNDDIGSSVKIDSVFHYFFREIKRLNLKDITTYKVSGDSWYSNEMYKQNKKMMFSVTSINHKK